VLSDEQQDFIDRVTEELRAPLAGAVNLLGAVVGGEASPLEARGYLETATRDSRRLLRFVDDLLCVARLRPPEPRELEAVPVGPWLRRCVEAARPAAEAAGHRLVLHDPSGAYVVKAVPGHLDLVLGHLLDNAVKFSETPGPIDVVAAPAEGLLRIAVSDKGIGFDPGDAGRMLECFARATNAEAARIPGAGVGLFLAAEIARFHGGRLWLESRRDEGTQAYLALPYEG
jgi:two-component system, OmpR family, phosphate regulon sensor histidine kinase PhoR